MKYGTTCKFCKNPITIEIDDAYMALGDPNNLIPLAACNPCADIRVLKRTLESKISRVCAAVSLMSLSEDKERNIARKTLVKLTKAYAEMIARWHHLEGAAWDEESVECLMEHPKEWNEIVGRYWKMFKQSVAQKEKHECNT